MKTQMAKSSASSVLTKSKTDKEELKLTYSILEAAQQLMQLSGDDEDININRRKRDNTKMNIEEEEEEEEPQSSSSSSEITSTETTIQEEEEEEEVLFDKEEEEEEGGGGPAKKNKMMKKKVKYRSIVDIYMSTKPISSSATNKIRRYSY